MSPKTTPSAPTPATSVVGFFQGLDADSWLKGHLIGCRTNKAVAYIPSVTNKEEEQQTPSPHPFARKVARGIQGDDRSSKDDVQAAQWRPWKRQRMKRALSERTLTRPEKYPGPIIRYGDAIHWHGMQPKAATWRPLSSGRMSHQRHHRHVQHQLLNHC